MFIYINNVVNFVIYLHKIFKLKVIRGIGKRIIERGTLLTVVDGSSIDSEPLNISCL